MLPGLERVEWHGHLFFDEAIVLVDSQRRVLAEWKIGVAEALRRRRVITFVICSLAL